MNAYDGCIPSRTGTNRIYDLFEDINFKDYSKKLYSIKYDLAVKTNEIYIGEVFLKNHTRINTTSSKRSVCSKSSKKSTFKSSK